jgi:hypothetical protein
MIGGSRNRINRRALERPFPGQDDLGRDRGTLALRSACPMDPIDVVTEQDGKLYRGRPIFLPNFVGEIDCR